MKNQEKPGTHRTTITFDEDLFKKIKARMGEKKIFLLTQCVRELVELALRVEEAAKNSSGKDDEPSEELKAILEVKEMLKNNLTWSMESRLLSRALIQHLPNSSQNKNADILAQCKEKAAAHIKGLVKEELD